MRVCEARHSIVRNIYFISGEQTTKEIESDVLNDIKNENEVR